MSALLQRAFIPVTLLAVAAFRGPDAVGSDHVDAFTRVVKVAKGGVFTLRATVGDIAIDGWDRPDIEVVIVRSAPSAELLDGLSTTIEQRGADVSVTAIQIAGHNDSRLRASVTVRVPIDQMLGAVELFEGRISLRDLRGGVRAKVEHGSIDAASVSGAIRLETGIGHLRLDHVELSERGLIRLRTFNGDVALGFSATPAHARILALSLGGSIRSDIPLTLRTRFGPRFGEATIGRGEPIVSIDVVNGDIRITNGKP